MASSISLPKSGLKTVLIESLYNEIVSNTNNYYYFIGKPQEWGNGAAAIESPTLAIASDSDTRRDMVFAKKITGVDVSFTIPRIDWKSGRVYDIYDDRVGDFVDLKASEVSAGSNILTFETANNTSISATTVESIMQKFGEGWAVIGFDSAAVTALNSDVNTDNDLASDNPIPGNTFVESASYNTLTGTITVVLDSTIAYNITTGTGTGNNTIRFQCLAYSGASSLKQSAENRNGPYVYTPDRHVYKCLYNNRGGVSTVMPYSTSHELIVTSDNYIWKYMYTIPNALFNKFMTTLDMPVTTAVRAPYYSGGAVTSATVQYYGSGYNYITTPSIVVKGDGYLADNPYRVTQFLVSDAGYGYVTPPTLIVDPPYPTVTWVANTTYATGTKVTVRSTDIYEVVAPGVSGTVPPIHTSVDPITNGTTLMKFVGQQAVIQVGTTQNFKITSVTSGNNITYTSPNGFVPVAGEQIQFTEAYTPSQMVTTVGILAGSTIDAPGHPFVANQAITFDYSCATSWVVTTSNVSTANSTFAITGHGLTTGCAVTYNANGSGGISGLSGVTLYVIYVNSNTIKLANSYANALSQSAVILGSQGVDTQTITYTPIVAGTTYYVKQVPILGSTFTISATVGGTAITLIPRLFFTNVRAAVAILPNIVYWISNATSSTFRISATQGGTDIVLAPNTLNFSPSSINTSNDKLTYTPTRIYNIARSNVNTTTDVLTIGNHRLITGSAVVYRAIGGNSLVVNGSVNNPIGGLVHNTTYYAIIVSSTAIKLATTANNAIAGVAIDIPTGDIYTGNDGQYLMHTTASNHGLPLDAAIKYYKNGKTAATIAGSQIADGSLFYVVDDGKNWTASTFKLSTSQDGGPVDFTSTSITTTTVVSTSNVNTTTSTITIGNHGFTTGTAVVYAPRGLSMISSLPASARATYYVIVTGTNTIRLAVSNYNAIHGIYVTLSTTGNSAQTIQYVSSAGNNSQLFSWYPWNSYGITIADVQASGTGGQFTCTSATLAVGKIITISGTLSGTGYGTILGYTSGNTYKVVSVVGTANNITGFTLQTMTGGLVITTPGPLSAAGLTFTSNVTSGAIGAYTQTGLGATQSFSTSQSFNVVSINSTSSINVPAGHSLYINQPVWFAASYGSSIVANQIYYVSANELTPTTFKIKASTGGSDISLSTVFAVYVTTVNTGAVISDVIYANNTLRANQVIKFASSVSSITSNTQYYVSATGLSSTSFKIKDTLTGSDKTISGTNKLSTTVSVFSGIVDLFSRGMLAYITISNPGRGYSPNSPPNVTINTNSSSDVGSGAKAVASVNSEGFLNRVVLYDRGKNYNVVPTVDIDAPPQLSAIFDGSSSSVVNISTNTITLPNAPTSITGCGFYTGARVKYLAGTNSAIGGLISGATYYAVATGSNTIKLAYSFYDAMKQINTIDFTSLGIGNHQISLDVEQATAYAEVYMGYGYTAIPSVTVTDPFLPSEVHVTFEGGLEGSIQPVTVGDMVVVPDLGEYAQKVFYKVIPTVYRVTDTSVHLATSTITIPDHNLTTGTPLTYYSGAGTGLTLASGTIASPTTTTFTINPVNVSIANNTITTASAHNLVTGAPLKYMINNTVGIAPLENEHTYYAVVVNTTQFKLALTAVNALAETPVVIDFTSTGNTLQTLSYTTAYYAVVVDSNTIQLATSMANAIETTPVVATITGVGSSTQYFEVLYPHLGKAPSNTSGIGKSGTATLQAVGKTAAITAVGEKTRAKIAPLIDNGGIVGVIIQDPGVGYTSADLTAPGSADPAIIVPNLSIGDVATRQANTELLAVPGTIDSIVVLHKGSNYSSSNIKVKITGDGTGAVATANVVDSEVVSIDVIDHGSGYSRATIEIIGTPVTGSGSTLEKAFARAIISPRRGHGNNAVTELYATDVTLTTTFGTEKNQGFYIGYEASSANVIHNDYRQFGILKNPQVIGSSLRYNKSLASPCYAVNIAFASNITYNATQKDQGDIPLDAVLIEKDSTKPAYRYVIVDSSSIADGARLLLSAVDNVAPYVGQTLKTSDKENIGTITSVTSPDIDKYSGEIMFVDNRQSFQTSADQTVAVKTTIRL